MPVLTHSVYYNTRVRGLKSRLLHRAQLEDLLQGGKTIQSMIDLLLDSSYRTEMAESLTRQEGVFSVGDALSRNLSNTFRFLMHNAEGGMRPYVECFLTRWDLNPIKALLRRMHQPAGTEVVPTLLPGPGMSPALLSEFARCDSMESLLAQFAAWNPGLCKGMNQALPEYLERGELSVLEEALDRAYFVGGAKRLDSNRALNARMLHSYLQAEIDRINLRLVFQHFYESSSGGAYLERLLPGGKLGEPLLRRMSEAQNPAAAMEFLDETRYSPLVEELFQFMQTHRFSPIERFFERFLMHTVRRMARQDVFAIGVVMDYAWLKYNEAINLRLIARVLAGNVPAGRAREEMYLV